MSDCASMSTLSVSRIVALSSTARTRMTPDSAFTSDTASVGECRSVHLDGDGIAQKCAYAWGDAVKAVRSAHPNVRQSVDNLRRGPHIQGQGGRIDADHHVQPGLLRRA